MKRPETIKIWFDEAERHGIVSVCFGEQRNRTKTYKIDMSYINENKLKALKELGFLKFQKA